MFGSLFRRAQATVDNAIDSVVNRAIVTIPFLVAAGFGTAALAMRLNREFGAETGSVILAFGFVGVGLLAALIVHGRRSRPAEVVEEAAESAERTAEAATEPGISDVDRELVMAALTTAAPLALPAILRALGRNLPLVAAIAAAGFVMTRDLRGTGRDEALEPAE
jgi:hypothetical protein